MARLLIYDAYENKVYTYANLNENDPMPYSTLTTLRLREFRGKSASPTLWTTIAAMEAWNLTRRKYGRGIPVGYAFRRIWEGGHGTRSQHYAGVAFDVGQSLDQRQRTAIYNAARATGAWGYVEPLSQTPTWVHFDRRYGTPACSGTTAGYPTLRRGSRGCYVMILQDALSTLGYQTGSRIDGIGLYRTEIPFMLQSGFPSEEEQVAQYQGMLQMFNDKPVTLRTLDVGADKQLPYMPISEENPCLGWRGIRITLDQPEIFLIQVRAMLRANAATGNLSILLPMVTSIDEIDEARRLIERAGREVEEMIGYAIPKPRIGVMLEVPSMVFMLPQLANRVDFISVGTNDLTQYILAVDRNNTRVASIYDSLHPAIIRALAMIAREAEQYGIDLRLCGEMAGDSMCVAILIGLGYRHLSMNGRAVARVKYLLRHIDINDARELAERSLEAQLAAEVRHQVAAFMERRGMGGLIRGGR